MNKFEYAEMIGRNKFKSLFDSIIKDCKLEFTKGKFDPIDAVITTNNGNSVAVEIKDRNPKYATYSAAYMENKKFRSLIAGIRNQQYKDALYVNFYGDKCSIWSVKEIAAAVKDGTIKWFNGDYNLTTAGDRRKVDKVMCEVPLYMAHKYQISDGKWVNKRWN